MNVPLRIAIFCMRSNRKWNYKQKRTIFDGILINLAPADILELLENYYFVVIYAVARQDKQAVVCEWIWDGLEIKLNIILDRNISSSSNKRKSLARWKEERGESRSICSAQLQLVVAVAIHRNWIFLFSFSWDLNLLIAMRSSIDRLSEAHNC